MSGVTSLDHIWVKRWNQDILAAKEGLAEVKAEKSWLELNPEELRYIKKSDYDLYLEALLLKSSLLRAENKLQKSSSLIASTFKKHKALKNNHNFKLHFELGLDHWCHEDIPSALDSFMLAEKTATNNHEKIHSLNNLLFCLEALDYERDHIEKKIIKELNYASKENIEYFTKKIDNYNLRKEFYRNGTVSWSPTKGSLNQADFFACFVSYLPYTNISNESNLKSISLDKNYLWQKSYRIRTINGFLTKEDNEVFRVADAIDRLYLWTWNFLKDGRHFTIKKIESTLFAIMNNLEIENLSVENKLLLRNSLKWLIIVSPKSVSPYIKYLEELNHINQKTYKLLTDELIFQNHVLESKFSEIEETNLFYKISKDLKLELPNLVEILNINNISIYSDKIFRLDISKNTIFNFKSLEEIHSPLISRLFYLMSRSKKFNITDIKDNFGSNKRQIYNLISRAKKFYPNLDINISERSITHNLELHQFEILNEFAESKVQEKVIFNRKKKSKSELIVSTNAIRLLHPESFTRKNFEEIFKFSKATATRILNEWVENNLIEKRGKGRSVEYIWSK